MNAFNKGKAASKPKANPADLLQRSRALARTDMPAERTLPLEALVVNPDQPRKYFDSDALEELTNSIREKGVLQPLMVRPLGGEQFEIVFGERRYRAAQKAGLSQVPVIVKDLSDDERDFLSAVENLQRRDLSKFEEADAKLRLIGLTLGIEISEVPGYLKACRTREADHIEAIGKLEQLFSQLGREQWRSYITNKLPLLRLPEPLLTSVRNGRIEYTKAVLISRAPSVHLTQLLEQAIENEWSQEEVRDAIRKVQPKTPKQADSLRIIRQQLTPANLGKLESQKRTKVESLLKELEQLLF